MRVPTNELGWNPEFALLGAMIVFSDKVPCPHGVNVEWFADPAARTIFGAIEGVRATGVMPGPIEVRRRLEAQGKLEKIGGEDFLAEVMESCVSALEVPDIVATLQPEYVARKVREVSAWLLKSADRMELSPGELSARLMEAAAATSGATSAPVRHISEVDHEGSDPGITTGFAGIDAFMGTGGYAAGQTNVISAYAKGGKTTFMLSSAVTLLKLGKRVLWATFADLNDKQLKRRIMRNICGWSKPPYDLELNQQYAASLEWLNDSKLDVYDASALETGYDIDTFGAWLKANHEIKGYDIVFVDYAQKLRTVNKRVTNAVAEGDYCSGAMARLAAATGLPAVVGSQITKGSAKDGTDTKTKNSRAWEEDAGLVVRLNREASTSLVMAVEIAFSRFGPTGDVSLVWNSERLRIEDPQ